MTEGRWPVGKAEVQNLIDEGEIEEVEPSPEHAELLMRQAETHLASAPVLLPADPPGAYAVLYDAARKSMGAVLAQQGLRATRKSGHRATQEAIEAQLGPNARRVVSPFRELRLRRHDAEYPGPETLEVTVDEAREALEDARGIVEAMKTFLPTSARGRAQRAESRRLGGPARTPRLDRERPGGRGGRLSRRQRTCRRARVAPQ